MNRPRANPQYSTLPLQALACPCTHWALEPTIGWRVWRGWRVWQRNKKGFEALLCFPFFSSVQFHFRPLCSFSLAHSPFPSPVVSFACFFRMVVILGWVRPSCQLPGLVAGGCSILSCSLASRCQVVVGMDWWNWLLGMEICAILLQTSTDHVLGKVFLQNSPQDLSNSEKFSPNSPPISCF